jgi:hypothetical protein
MKCGHDNEANANFCRNCGESITIVKGTQTSKDQVEFVPQKQRRLESDVAGGYIVGVVFIVVGIIITVAMFTTLFSDFGTTIGNLAGGFGESMGQMGSDIGNFFGNWGENFGASVGTFFSGQRWWDWLKILIPFAFIIVGVIAIILNFNKSR